MFTPHIILFSTPISFAGQKYTNASFAIATFRTRIIKEITLIRGNSELQAEECDEMK